MLCKVSHSIRNGNITRKAYVNCKSEHTELVNLIKVNLLKAEQNFNRTLGLVNGNMFVLNHLQIW